jgi:hypothetical protein
MTEKAPMMRLFQRMAITVAILALAVSAWAGQIFVDGKHPAASDTNPGTEAWASSWR